MNLKKVGTVGIDLGTTMSALAYVDISGIDSKPEISKTKEGLHLTRSIVCLDNNNDIRVGSINCNGNTAKMFKRYMGDKNYTVDINGREYSPIELSSFVLKKLKEDAENNGIAVKDVVITVPAYFDEERRVATKEAGKMAGLNVVSIINEPTAAALFYASETDTVKGKILIFDLGGGTFDITVLNLQDSNVDVIASGGDPMLGGMDFDNLIFEIIEEKYREKFPNGVAYEDNDEKEELMEEAENIKKTLSLDEDSALKITGSEGKAKLTITRKDFEDKMRNKYLTRMKLEMEDVFDDIDLSPFDIEHILLVGGSTRIPIIRELIKDVFGKDPIGTLDVDEAVVKGATLKATMIKSKQEPNTVTSTIRKDMDRLSISDIATVSFGVLALENDILKNTIVIKKGTKIPCTVTKNFSTAYDGQKGIKVEITTGESENKDEVTVVDDFTIDLPEDRPKGQPLEIRYSYAEDQTLECMIKDISSGRTKKYNAENLFK